MSMRRLSTKAIEECFGVVAAVAIALALLLAGSICAP